MTIPYPPSPNVGAILPAANCFRPSSLRELSGGSKGVLIYEVKEPFWQLIDHWQTLITGVLALAAAAGTVWATIKSANREIAAAQEQTQAAQHQTTVTREIERRRLAREGYAFHAMLEAAVAAVIEDVQAARKLPPPAPSSGTYSDEAYAVRQRVKRASFAELRNALLRFGERHASEFLQLDKEIEDFAGQSVGRVSLPAPGALQSRPVGFNAGLQEQLDRIEQHATDLRGWAAGGMKMMFLVCSKKDFKV